MMEYLKRKIKAEREETHNPMSCSLINGCRLSIRWADKDKPNTDTILNFTAEETKNIKKILRYFND